jgi:hypothetical protein
MGCARCNLVSRNKLNPFFDSSTLAETQKGTHIRLQTNHLADEIVSHSHFVALSHSLNLYLSFSGHNTAPLEDKKLTRLRRARFRFHHPKWAFRTTSAMILCSFIHFASDFRSLSPCSSSSACPPSRPRSPTVNNLPKIDPHFFFLPHNDISSTTPNITPPNTLVLKSLPKRTRFLPFSPTPPLSNPARRYALNFDVFDSKCSSFEPPFHKIGFAHRSPNFVLRIIMISHQNPLNRLLQTRFPAKSPSNESTFDVFSPLLSSPHRLADNHPKSIDLTPCRLFLVRISQKYGLNRQKARFLRVLAAPQLCDTAHRHGDYCADFEGFFGFFGPSF